jgi:hypothetical protein
MSFSMSMPPFIPDTRGTPQPPLVSPGFSGKGTGPIPGSLAFSIKQRPESRVDYGNLKPIEVNPGAHTPQLSRVYNQPYANGPFPQKVQYHHDTYQQSAAPSPAPQSRFGKMFNKAKEYAGFWKHQRQQRPQQQQRPDTRGPSSLEIQRTKALHTLGLDLDSNPTRADVKRAFNKAALGNHPDKVADRTEKFIEVYKAYKFLISNLGNQNGGNMAKIGGNNTIKRRRKKHKLAKKTRSKKHSNRRSKTRGKTYRKTRKNTTKRRR